MRNNEFINSIIAKYIFGFYNYKKFESRNNNISSNRHLQNFFSGL